MHRILIAMAIVVSCSAADGPAPGQRLPLPLRDPDAGVTDATARRAVFAGGCFWCVEGVFEQIAGVRDARSGYVGGNAQTANYQAVCTGATGHAEAVEITYDPTKVTFGQLMRVFFATHDPTTKDRQGPDAGTQYRSSIFWVDEPQRAAAEAYIAQLDAAAAFPRPIVTRLEKLGTFHPAETDHQDFVRLNPNHPYIRHQALPKIEKLRLMFPEVQKPPATDAPKP